jgi:hypothetical protein
MELEFRAERGDFKFSLHGNLADITHSALMKIPELKKDIRKTNKGEFIVFIALQECGYSLLGEQLQVVFEKGDYVKIK